MDKKTQIMKAAMELLIENGVQGTPMSAIAKKAGTGMGTIYNYFTTKEELINNIYLYIKEDEVQALLKPFNDESVKRQFDHFYSAMVQYLIGHPLHFAFMDQFHNSPLLTAETKAQGLQAIASIFELIARGQQQGIIKNIEAEELLEFLNGGLAGFVRWVLNNDKKLDKKMLDNQLRIAWDAVKQ